jgi:hypothetical protein
VSVSLLLPILSLFFGETLSICGELLAAKGRLLEGTLIGLPGWLLLVYAYWAGYRAGGIWQLTAFSLGSILVVEPLLVTFLFREIPSRNSLIGCLFGAVGLIIASIKS